MTSGDVLKVEAASISMQTAFDAAITEKVPSAQSSNKEAVPLAAAPVFLWAAAVWDVAVAVNYAGVVNVAGAVLVSVKFWTKKSSSTDGELAREENVADYSQALVGLK